MKNVFIKDAQSSFHKTITWVKNSVEGIEEWVKACKDAFLYPWKLTTPTKTQFVYKVIIFKETSKNLNVKCQIFLFTIYNPLLCKSKFQI